MDQAKAGDAYWADRAALAFADGLAFAMQRNELDIETISRRLGRDPVYVSQALAGEWSIDIEDMAILARAAGAELEIKVTL